MTDEQKFAIENLRSQGFGYKKIASETGISMGTVKSYFQRAKDKEMASHELTDPVVTETNTGMEPSNMQDAYSVTAEAVGSEIKVGEFGTPIMRQQCLFCGKPVVQMPGRKEKKFCSDACRIHWWSKNKYIVPRKSRRTFVCQSCGEEFTAYGTDNRKYCSHACYISARFRGGAACV